MNTIVDFERAKLLKKKKFSPDENNHELLWIINTRMKCPILGPNPKITVSNYSEDCEFYSAPTIGEVIMWVYKKHGIWIGVQPTSFVGKFQFRTYWNNNNVMNQHWNDSMGKEFNSPTEAYEAAITYTLKKLI